MSKEEDWHEMLAPPCGGWASVSSAYEDGRYTILVECRPCGVVTRYAAEGTHEDMHRAAAEQAQRFQHGPEQEGT